MFGINQKLDVIIFDKPDDAAQNGFDYSKTNAAPVEIKFVVIVNKGTQSGKPTIDLVLKDQQGNTYITMMTGALIKSLPL